MSVINSRTASDRANWYLVGINFARKNRVKVEKE